MEADAGSLVAEIVKSQLLDMGWHDVCIIKLGQWSAVVGTDPAGNQFHFDIVVNFDIEPASVKVVVKDHNVGVIKRVVHYEDITFLTPCGRAAFSNIVVTTELDAVTCKVCRGSARFKYLRLIGSDSAPDVGS